MITTGIRWAESNKRRERETFEVITRDKNKKVQVTDGKIFSESIRIHCRRRNAP